MAEWTQNLSLLVEQSYLGFTDLFFANKCVRLNQNPQKEILLFFFVNFLIFPEFVVSDNYQWLHTGLGLFIVLNGLCHFPNVAVLTVCEIHVLRQQVVMRADFLVFSWNQVVFYVAHVITAQESYFDSQMGAWDFEFVLREQFAYLHFVGAFGQHNISLGVVQCESAHHHHMSILVCECQL